MCVLRYEKHDGSEKLCTCKKDCTWQSGTKCTSTSSSCLLANLYHSIQINPIWPSNTASNVSTARQWTQTQKRLIFLTPFHEMEYWSKSEGRHTREIETDTAVSLSFAGTLSLPGIWTTFKHNCMVNHNICIKSFIKLWSSCQYLALLSKNYITIKHRQDDLNNMTV